MEGEFGPEDYVVLALQLLEKAKSVVPVDAPGYTSLFEAVDGASMFLWLREKAKNGKGAK